MQVDGHGVTGVEDDLPSLLAGKRGSGHVDPEEDVGGGCPPRFTVLTHAGEGAGQDRRAGQPPLDEVDLGCVPDPVRSRPSTPARSWSDFPNRCATARYRQRGIASFHGRYRRPLTAAP
jgi:hypothetical protein